MGKQIRGQRKGRCTVFKSHVRLRKGKIQHRTYDFAERHGYIKGVIKEIMHEPGRGAPIANRQGRVAASSLRGGRTGGRAIPSPPGMGMGAQRLSALWRVAHFQLINAV